MVTMELVNDKKFNEVAGKEQGVTMDIQEFLDEICLEVWEKGTEFLKVVDDFAKSGKRIFLVRFPVIEEDSDMLFFQDPDRIIASNNLILMGFLKTSIVRISKHEVGEICSYIIEFSDGTVTLEPLIY